MSWPNRIKDKGGLRSQFHHAIDIAPTILEVAGIPEPRMVNGVPQKPIEGVSMAYTFDDANAPEPTQRRSISRCSATARSTTTDGSPAAATASCHGRPPARASFDNDTWELYNIDEDFSQANDLAKKEPKKLQRPAGSASWLRLPSTTCCRSTIASPSAPTRT